LAELVKSGKITDWNRVVQRASDTRCERSGWLGLRLARDLLDARLPPAIEQHIAPLLAVERLTGQVVEWLQNAEGAAASRTIADRFLYRMRLYPRWRDGMLQMANYMRAWPARSLRWNP
jgi:hypothetical protein